MDSLVRFSEINQSKPFEFHLILSSQKISELIERLDLLNIKKVSLVQKNINYSAALTPIFTSSLRQLSLSFVIGVKSL